MSTSAKLLTSLLVLTSLSCHSHGQNCDYLSPNRLKSTYQPVLTLVNFQKPPAPVSVSVCLIQAGAPCLGTLSSPLDLLGPLEMDDFCRYISSLPPAAPIAKDLVCNSHSLTATLTPTDNSLMFFALNMNQEEIDRFIRFGCESAKCSRNVTGWFCEPGTRTAEVWNFHFTKLGYGVLQSATTRGPLTDQDFILPPGYPNDWNAGEDDLSSVNPGVNLPSCAILIAIGIIALLLPRFGSY